MGAVCRDRHARADTKPKLLPEIPQIKFEGGTELITLTNQQPFIATVPAATMKS